MFRNFLLLSLLLLSSRASWAIIPVTKPSPAIKTDSSCWQFKNQAQMEKVIKRWWDEPRASYYIINNAYANHLALPAATLYIQHSQNGINMKRVAIAAYACMVASGSFSVQVGRSYPKEMQDAASYGGFAYGMLDDALKEFPNSPEIMVMAAACRIDANLGVSPPSEAWPKILNLLRHAKQFDPKWADVYYWEGVALDFYGEGRLGRNTQALNLAKIAISTTERLDPGMKTVCYRMQGLIAEDRGLYQESLNYIDAWLKLQPQSARMRNIQIWRARVVNSLSAKK